MVEPPDEAHALQTLCNPQEAAVYALIELQAKRMRKVTPPWIALHPRKLRAATGRVHAPRVAAITQQRDLATIRLISSLYAKTFELRQARFRK